MALFEVKKVGLKEIGGHRGGGEVCGGSQSTVAVKHVVGRSSKGTMGLLKNPQSVIPECFIGPARRRQESSL